METKDLVLVANQAQQLNGGLFFMILDSSAAVDIQFFKYRNQPDMKATGVLAGFSAIFKEDEAFSSVSITSTVNQTVKIAISSEASASYTRIAGSITAIDQPGTSLNHPVDVNIPNGTGAGTLIIAANANALERIVKNLSTSAALVRVKDSNEADMTGYPLDIGEAIVIKNSGALYGFTNLGNATIAVIENLK